MNRYVLIMTVVSTLLCTSICMYIKFFTNNMIIGGLITFVMFFVIYSFMSSIIKDLLNPGSKLNSDLKARNAIGKKEGFTTLASSGSNYKKTRSPLLLEDIYPANVPFKKSEETYETMWKNYPSFPARSNQTNLIKHWAHPSNGTCTLPHQCGAFYKKITPMKDRKPTPPSFGSGVRVNFYDTCVNAKSNQS